MTKFISSFIPKPFARITVDGSRCIVRIDEAPRVLCHESEQAKLELVWMSERRFNGLSEAIEF